MSKQFTKEERRSHKAEKASKEESKKNTAEKVEKTEKAKSVSVKVRRFDDIDDYDWAKTSDDF